MLSKEQIALARKIAHERQKFHEQFKGDPNHLIADNLTDEEAHFRGLCGEFELSNVFGTQVDLVLRRSGDDQDAFLLLTEGRFRADVKCSAYNGYDPYLRVPQYDIKPEVIYVAARFDPFWPENVKLIGWEWGMVMMRCELRSFTSKGVSNHIKLYRKLRHLDELKQREVKAPLEQSAPQVKCVMCNGVKGTFKRATYIGAPDGGVPVHDRCLNALFAKIDQGHDPWIERHV